MAGKFLNVRWKLLRKSANEIRDFPDSHGVFCQICFVRWTEFVVLSCGQQSLARNECKVTQWTVYPVVIYTISVTLIIVNSHDTCSSMINMMPIHLVKNYGIVQFTAEPPWRMRNIASVSILWWYRNLMKYIRWWFTWTCMNVIHNHEPLDYGEIQYFTEIENMICS